MSCFTLSHYGLSRDLLCMYDVDTLDFWPFLRRLTYAKNTNVFLMPISFSFFYLLSRQLWCDSFLLRWVESRIGQNRVKLNHACFNIVAAKDTKKENYWAAFSNRGSVGVMMSFILTVLDQCLSTGGSHYLPYFCVAKHNLFH